MVSLSSKNLDWETQVTAIDGAVRAGGAFASDACPPEFTSLVGSLPVSAWGSRSYRCVGLPVVVRAVVLALHEVRLACAVWAVPHLYECAAACVSELVANAVQHAVWPVDADGRSVWLAVSLAGPFLLVEVSDPDRRLPVLGGPVDWDRFEWSASDADDGLGESGFGLFTVVARVGEIGGEFGVVINDVGKTVFVALPLSGRAPVAGLVPGDTAPVDGAGRV